MEINLSLKKAFRFNALFSTICALTLLLASNWWALQFGQIDSLFVVAGAVGLIVFASYLLWISTTARQSRMNIFSIIASDWGYVLAALLAVGLAWNLLSPIGATFLIVTAVVVAVAAEWQRRAANSPQSLETD